MSASRSILQVWAESHKNEAGADLSAHDENLAGVGRTVDSVPIRFPVAITEVRLTLALFST
jgi:hypothetical protein